ncbi:MAG: CAP domain-containing protein [Acidobacteriales bacterium]|nr:CAP domain-containing protein [Terriglobales bacterium]
MKKNIVVALLGAWFCFTASWKAGAANAIPDAERELVRLINEERARKGAKPVQTDERLTEAARTHSEIMAQHKQLAHRFPGEERLEDRLGKTGVPFDAVAENVAFSGSAAEAHEQLMLSSGHRANILNPKYNAVGVGVIERNGRLYVTQAFAHRLPEFGAGEIEQSILDAFNTLRKQNRLPEVMRTRVNRLRDFACEEKVTAQRALQRFGGPESAVVFTGSDPNDLPSQMQKMAGQRWIGSMAVGACPPSNTRSTYAMYNVVALFYR